MKRIALVLALLTPLAARAQNVQPVPASSSLAGVSANLQATLSNSAQTVKSTAGGLYAAICYNPNGSVAFVQVYNTTSPTVGTTTPIVVVPVPSTLNGGISLMFPVWFTTAIAVAATTTATGGSAPSTALNCTFTYK